jgi:hypothetical protein
VPRFITARAWCGKRALTPGIRPLMPGVTLRRPGIPVGPGA